MQLISASTLDYQAVWLRICHAPNASEWSNVLILANLPGPVPYGQSSTGSSSSTPDTATDDLSVDSENDTSDSESDCLHDWDRWMCDSNSDNPFLDVFNSNCH